MISSKIFANRSCGSGDRAARSRLSASRRSAAALLVLGAACTNDESDTPDDAGLTTTDSAVEDDDTDDSAVDHDEHAATGDAMADDDPDATTHHACADPYPKDPRDDTMTGELVRVVTGDNGTPDDPSDDPYELLLPQEMLDWLAEQNWIQEHGDWHNVRRCTESCQRTSPGSVCQSTDSLAARGLSCAPIQEGEDGDGYAFLVMHRHMIRGFQQAFPKHLEQIRGFQYIPTSKYDPENAIPWVDVRWSDAQLDTIEFMNNIAEHIDVFTSEDDYARWVQFGDGQSGGGGGFTIPGDLPDGGGFPGGLVLGDGGLSGFPGGGFPGLDTDAGSFAIPTDAAAAGSGGATNRPGGGIHGGLHAQWAVPNSPSSLVDNNKNVQNFAFWKLHTWMDEMWERFRKARGLGEDDPDYQQALIEQCEEMHELGKALPPASQDPSDEDGGTTPEETGVFATEVAPVLNSYCGGSVCHGADSPTLGLALAGTQASVIREGLVGKQSSEASMALVEPGQPEQSWIYLKITGNFATVDCSVASCTSMPPAGAKPNEGEIERIRAWIAAGAE